MLPHEAAAQLGVAAYTVMSVDADGDRWAVTVHDMANHIESVRYLPRDPNLDVIAAAAVAVVDLLGETLTDALRTAVAPMAQAISEVPAGPAKALIAWVGTDADRARATLEVELARDKPRVTVVEPLRKLLGDAG